MMVSVCKIKEHKERETKRSGMYFILNVNPFVKKCHIVF